MSLHTEILSPQGRQMRALRALEKRSRYIQEALRICSEVKDLEAKKMALLKRLAKALGKIKP